MVLSVLWRFYRTKRWCICEENFGTKSENFTFIDSTNLTYGYEILSYQHACIGNEASLCDCHKTSQNCLSTNAVAIKCQRPGIDLILYHIVLAML